MSVASPRPPASAPAVPPPPRRPPSGGGGAPPARQGNRRGRIGLRIAVGCLIVLACSAGASAVFVSGEVQTLRQDLSQNPSISGGDLASAGWGDPQTLLLVGDDQRALTPYYHVAVLPHSNEMLLVRIDPSKPYISMMSIPRELQVTIHPRSGPPITTRFNYAYTAGGIPLLVSTIKQVLGLSVNHVMVVTFGHFKRAVDQMGCVYSTVDRRYYHVNTPGGEQYQEIDLQPGYQQLCGDQALQFVSYRHLDTSLVRDARDQSFLLDVKKQYGPTLADNVHQFEQIFGQAIQTDPGLHSTTGLLNLIGTLISSSGRRVRQVQFQANLLPTFDTATPRQIASSVHAFLYGGSPIPKQRTAALAGKVGGGRGSAQLPLVATSSGQVSLAQSKAQGIPFPYEFPRVQDRAGSGTPIRLRDYRIQAPDGNWYPIYTEVFAAGDVGQYYDVQGTTWGAAPQFESPDQSVQVGPRKYFLYYEGEKLKMVAWSEHGAVYWVRNSLTDSIANGELLAIAEQTDSIDGSGSFSRAPGVKLGAAPVPIRTSTKEAISARETAGTVAALATLLAAPLLGLVWFRRRREIRGLRAELRANELKEARMRGVLARLGRS